MPRRRNGRVARLGIVMLGLLLASPGPALAAPPAVEVSVVQSGLSIPWDVAFTPSGRMLVTERAGTLRLYAGGWWHAPLLATLQVPDVHAEGDAGLMGIAVDVNFAFNRFIYLCASRDVGDAWLNQVLRYRLVNRQLTDEHLVIGSGMLAGVMHNGCALEMDDRGRLWVTMGDSGRRWLAQDPDSYNGKVLRVSRRGNVPASNPVLPGAAGRSAVFSMGHRNPQGLAFRPSDDAVFVSEHGPDRDDEINRIRRGRNYGWPCVTGANQPLADDPACGAPDAYEPASWSSGGATLATSGAAFRTGAAWAAWNGQLFVSALKHRDLRRFEVNASGSGAAPVGIEFDRAWGRLRAAVRGPGGTLYLTTSNGDAPGSDRVIRLRPASP